MRVAYVCADRGVPVFGNKGGSIHVREVIRHLLQHGAKVELFATRFGGDPPPGFASVALHRLPRGRGRDPIDRERSALQANDALRDALGCAEPFDLVYERHALWSYAGMEHARRCGIPALLEVNAPLLAEQQRYRALHHVAAAEETVARAFAAASGFVAVSDGVAETIREHPAAAAPVHVIPNGVDPARFAAAAEAVRDTGDVTIGFVGTLKPWHAVGDLLDAFGMVRAAGIAARLLIVGDGPERAALALRATEMELADHVAFTGAVDMDRVPDMIAAMDIAVAPYPALDRFYFSPLKLFEYMAAGRAIVAADVGQVPSLLEEGSTGLLYAPGDVSALAERLVRLAGDAALRRRLGARARRIAVDRHTWGSVVERILSLAAPTGAPLRRVI